MPGQKQVGPAPGQIEAEPGQGKWTEVEVPVAPVPGSLPQPQRAAGVGGRRLEAGGWRLGATPLLWSCLWMVVASGESKSGKDSSLLVSDLVSHTSFSSPFIPPSRPPAQLPPFPLRKGFILYFSHVRGLTHKRRLAKSSRAHLVLVHTCGLQSNPQTVLLWIRLLESLRQKSPFCLLIRSAWSFLDPEPARQSRSFYDFDHPVP